MKAANPVVIVEGVRYVLTPQFTAAVSLTELGRTVGSLAAERDRIKTAVDMVFDGV